MKEKNSLSLLAVIIITIFYVSACSMLKSSEPENKSVVANTENKSTAKSDNSAVKDENANNSAKSDASTAAPLNKPKEPADFTVTAENLDKEFTSETATRESLQKYAMKNIAVTGRVSLISREKSGKVQPWVTLYAPGIGHGINCYFEDENVKQMDVLKDNQMVKVQGFQDDFIVPKVKPMLKDCVVLEAK